MKWFLVFASSLLLNANAWSAVTLNQAYRKALKVMETVQIEQAKAKEAHENFVQARGEMFPHLSATAEYQRQDVNSTSSSESTAKAFREADQTTAQLTLTQPIFHGLSYIAGLHRTTALEHSQKLLVKQEKLSLYQSVASAFFDVLAKQVDVQHLQKQLDLTMARIKELKQRAKIGRSQVTDVLSAESQAALTASEVEAARSALLSAQQMLSSLTGLEPEATLSEDHLQNPSELKPLSYYVGRVKNRFDVQSLHLQLKAAKDNVTAVRGDHFPAVDLNGDYYLKRSGILEGAKWDVVVNLTLPLFEGGVTQSKVRAAVDQQREAQLQLSLAKRNAKTSITTLYQQIRSLLKQVELLRVAVIKAQKSFDTNVKNYRYGLVTNLDVLQALNTAIGTARSLDASRFQLHTALVSLNVAAAIAPRESL